ncbi:hypothetical protein Tco_0148403, partial [Tanacetum coccineum]
GQPSEPQPPSLTAPPSQVTTVATQHQKTHKPRRAKKGRDIEIPRSSGPPKKVGDEAVYTREDDRVVRAATTAYSLEAKQESDCSRLGDLKVEKENQKIRKGIKGKNSRDEALQDCDFDVLDDAMENVEGDSTAEQITTAGDTLNTASISVSVAGPSHVSIAR